MDAQVTVVDPTEVVTYAKGQKVLGFIATAVRPKGDVMQMYGSAAAAGSGTAPVITAKDCASLFGHLGCGFLPGV